MSRCVGVYDDGRDAGACSRSSGCGLSGCPYVAPLPSPRVISREEFDLIPKEEVTSVAPITQEELERRKQFKLALPERALGWYGRGRLPVDMVAAVRLAEDLSRLLSTPHMGDRTYAFVRRDWLIRQLELVGVRGAVPVTVVHTHPLRQEPCETTYPSMAAAVEDVSRQTHMSAEEVAAGLSGDGVALGAALWRVKR